jgi:hypothetical protein
MSEHKGAKLVLAFLAGAAVGAAVGYFMNSDKKDEIFAKVKDKASKIKDDLAEEIKKGKTVIENLRKGKAEEPAPETNA